MYVSRWFIEDIQFKNIVLFFQATSTLDTSYVSFFCVLAIGVFTFSLVILLFLSIIVFLFSVKKEQPPKKKEKGLLFYGKT